MGKAPKDDQGELPDDESARRRDEVLKRMLNTPPKPRKAKEPKRPQKRDG